MSTFEQKLDFSNGPHADPSVWLPRLTRLLSDQYTLAQRLEHMGRERSELLASGDYTTYLARLDERTPIIREMVIISDELGPFIDRFGTLSASLRTDEREAIHQQTARIDATLATINQRDADEAEVLHTKRDAIARELAEVGTGRGALAAYGSTPSLDDAATHDHEG